MNSVLTTVIFEFFESDGTLKYTISQPTGRTRYTGERLPEDDFSFYRELIPTELPMVRLFTILTYNLSCDAAKEVLSELPRDIKGYYSTWLQSVASRPYIEPQRRRRKKTPRRTERRTNVIKPLSMERDGVNREDERDDATREEDREWDR